ncbi:MAG: cation-transporting P-type ATPase [Solirubrobacterales bacterium]
MSGGTQHQLQEKGLTTSEAESRLRRDGPNRVPEAPPPSRLELLGRQLANPMVALLGLAAVVSVAIGEWLDAGIIVAIALANTALGYFQEGRAEGASRSLRRLMAPMATVLRDGKIRRVSAEMLVARDLVRLRGGDRVPADLSLTSEDGLEVDESAITGESLPVAKRLGSTLYAGAIVTRGTGEGVVEATGSETEIGRAVMSALRIPRTPTPLQRRLQRFAGFLLRAAVLLCLVLAGLAWAQGESLADSFLIGVSLAVAAVPEGLPAVLTIALALGVQRMAERGAIAKRLEAVETLGSATVICADKTGTITENRMSLARLYPCALGTEVAPHDGEGAEAIDELLTASLLASDELVGGADGSADASVEPVEAAIAETASNRGIDAGRVFADREVVGMRPFDSERKRMSVTVESPEGRVLFAKGAPETMLGLLTDGADSSNLRAYSERWAREGMRVLMVAKRELAADDDEELELMPLGLLGIHDAARAGVAESVQEAREAGVRTVMITGDHPGTALAIARETGVVEDDHTSVLTGAELDELSDDELATRNSDVRVYARVVPRHKVRIVDALRRRGEVVAMTGDGVNDVPALGAADIGVAMGERGTDAARAAADLVLTDDDYSTIVEAIRRGRSIYENVLRFVHFLIAANAGEVMVFALAIALGLDAPLTVVQILVVNLLTDGLPAVALAVDPPERDAMQQPPRPPAQGILDPIRGRLIVGGIATGLAAFVSFLIGESDSHAIGQTMAFATLVFAQLTHVFAVRGTNWFFRAGRNTALIGAVLLSAAVQAVILVVPGVSERFDVVALSPVQVAWALALAMVPFLAVELFKAVTRDRSPVDA